MMRARGPNSDSHPTVLRNRGRQREEAGIENPRRAAFIDNNTFEEILPERRVSDLDDKKSRNSKSRREPKDESSGCFFFQACSTLKIS